MSDSSNDQIDELISSCRGNARRLRALAQRGRDQDAGRSFAAGVTDAAELIEACATVLVRPDTRVPALVKPEFGAGVTKDTPEQIAAKMSKALQRDNGASTERSAESLLQEASAELCGTCKAFPGPQLVDFLGTLEKSGVLQIKTAKEVFTIQLERGYVLYASSNNAPRGSRLGDILVDMAFLDKSTLERHLRSIGVQTSRLGAQLVQDGLVTEQGLTDALTRQVQMLFQRLAEAENAIFFFREAAPSDAQNQIRLNVSHVLLESARMQDESQRPVA